MIFEGIFGVVLICVRDLHGQQILVRVGAGIINESSFGLAKIF